MKEIKGILAAIVTPMNDDGEINENNLRIIINRLIKAGIHGLFCLGTTGEFYSLTLKEKEFILETVLDEVKGRVPVYANTGGISTREVIQLTRRAKEMGVDAVSVITPYFIAPSQKELYMHYKIIAESVDIPILIYNIPKRTGVNIESDTVAELSSLPNIVGIKDSSGDFDNIKACIDKTDKDFCVLAGADSLIYRTLSAGGKGAVAATANLLPEVAVSIYENFMKGNMGAAKEAQDKLSGIRDSFKYGTAPGIIKEVANLMGMPAGTARMPIEKLDDDTINKIKDSLKGYL